MRRLLLVLAAVALPLAVRAQSASDVAAYLGTALTTGIEAPRAEQPELGDRTNTWGLHVFYTHLNFGDLALPGPLATSANAYGGSVSSSFLSGRLGLTATGGYVARSCPAGASCTGFADVGGSALFRVLRAAVGSDSGGRVTLSLRAAGGWAFAPDSDRYVSATVGLPIALSAPDGSYRVVGWVTPGLAWGSLRTTTLNAEDVRVPFRHEGTVGMLSGGVAFVPSASGVGVSLGVERIFVTHAGTQFSAALTWNMPRFGDR